MIPQGSRPPMLDVTDHKLRIANGLLATDIEFTWQGFTPPIRLRAGLTDLSDLADIYICGPTPEPGGEAFPQALYAYRLGQEPSRGRVNFTGAVDASSSKYPDVPWGTVLSEIFEVLQPDPTRPDASSGTRIYGRININTATREVLRQLPLTKYLVLNGTDWFLDLNDNGSQNTAVAIDVGLTFSLSPVIINEPTVDVEKIIDYILGYRDMVALTSEVPPGPNYADRPTLSPTLTGLRGASPIKGFLTPGEIAIPLAQYIADRLRDPANLTSGDFRDFKKWSGYLETRDSLYKAISNLITVKSDVFAANIVVQLRDGEDPTAVKRTWKYLAVIDRSNCREGGHLPAVLLFTEIE